MPLHALLHHGIVRGARTHKFFIHAAQLRHLEIVAINQLDNLGPHAQGRLVKLLQFLIIGHIVAGGIQAAQFAQQTINVISLGKDACL